MSTLTPPVERLAYSVADAVAATGLGRSTIYGLMEDGTLPFTQIRGRRVIAASALRKLVGEPTAPMALVERSTRPKAPSSGCR